MTTEETNTCWDEVKELHQSAIEMINATATTSSIFRNKEALAKVVNRPALIVAGERLMNDLNGFKQRIDAISTQHLNPQTGDNEADENMRSIMVGQSYQKWIDDFTLVITPTINTIDELINEKSAEELHREREAKEAREAAKLAKRQTEAAAQAKLPPNARVIKPKAPRRRKAATQGQRSAINVSELLEMASGGKKKK